MLNMGCSMRKVLRACKAVILMTQQNREWYLHGNQAYKEFGLHGSVISTQQKQSSTRDHSRYRYNKSS